ncbi:MAG: DUF1365 domain-containing protein [Betaproteobacteria bacterium]
MKALAFIPELILGEVIHHRTRPVEHRLEYSVFCLRIPVTAIPALPRFGLPAGRFGWVTFSERDHGPRDGSPIEAWIRRILAEHQVEADGEIELVCFPRMLGYAFKPVSFWVCRDRSNAVRAVLAEVRNTFGESHNYLLSHDDGSPLLNGQALCAQKVFHVSPFLDVKGTYTFRFHFGPGRWLARIDYADESGAVLSTSLGGESVPLGRATLRRAALRFPVQAFATIARIHWHALLLWAKSVRLFTKPHPPAKETTR